MLAISLPAAGQNIHSAPADDPQSVLDYEAAIEMIATSTNSEAVQAADEMLRTGGLDAIAALVEHLDDERQAKSGDRTRAVSGRVEMGDLCFWLIQDQLEDLTSKLDVAFSPLTRENAKAWLEARREMSLYELRREACIGAFAAILQYERSHKRFDAAPWFRKYANRLTELDARLYSADNKAVNRSTQLRGN